MGQTNQADESFVISLKFMLLFINLLLWTCKKLIWCNCVSFMFDYAPIEIMCSSVIRGLAKSKRATCTCRPPSNKSVNSQKRCIDWKQGKLHKIIMMT